MHTTLSLYTTADAYWLAPCDPNAFALSISRADGQVKVCPFDAVKCADFSHLQTVQAFLGMIKLRSGPFLIVARRGTLIGKLGNDEVYSADAVELLPCAVQANLADDVYADECKYVALIKQFFSSTKWFFSYSYKLTNCLSKQSELPKDQFLANSFLLATLHELSTSPKSEVESFVVNCIEGFVGIHSENGVHFALISRRSWRRTGSRYHSRGADAEGNVSNFVETEQILIKKESSYSFLQVRGSIPVYWQQILNIKYKPRLAVAHDATGNAMQKHLSACCSEYGKIVVLNLIGTGYEQPLAVEFKAQLERLRLSDVEYIHFDFNRECGKTSFANLSKLSALLKGHIQSHGFFSKLGNMIMRQQSGVIRSNCIDCLDRTNVVQSLLARTVLDIQLNEIGCTVEDSVFRNVWSDNADAISTQYSGTGALKTDFTRTGQRTLRGLLNDGTNSAMRYLKNNFADGQRQDAIDLVYGKYRATAHSPFLRMRQPHTYAVPMLFALVFGAMSVAIVAPSRVTALHRIFVIVGLAAMYFMAKIVRQRALDFVNVPLLVPLNVYNKR